MKPLITMREALYDRNIFDAGDQSWLAWDILSIAGMGEELTDAERPTFTQRDRIRARAAAARRRADRPERQAIWRNDVHGQAAGSTSAACAPMMMFSMPGSRGCGLFLASTQEQATVAFNRAVGIIDASPILKSMVVKTTREPITLSNNV